MERQVEFLRENRLRVLAVAGLWLAAATLVRPVTYYLPVALALGFFLVFARVPGLSPQRGSIAGDPGLRWKAPAVLLISVLPWLAAWQIRNYVETGYGGLSSITEVNLYAIVTAVTANGEQQHWPDMHKDLGVSDKQPDFHYQPYLAQYPEARGWSQVQCLTYMHSEAIRVIRAHHGFFLHGVLISFFETVFNPGAGWYDDLFSPENSTHNASIAIGQSPISRAISLAKAYPWIVAEKAAFEVVLLVLYLFAVRGVFRGDMRNAYKWLLLGTSLYFLIITAVAAGRETDAHYRLPVMPIVCIFAAAGFQRTKTIEMRDVR
jgi:hypothetical protein